MPLTSAYDCSGLTKDPARLQASSNFPHTSGSTSNSFSWSLSVPFSIESIFICSRWTSLVCSCLNCSKFFLNLFSSQAVPRNLKIAKEIAELPPPYRIIFPTISYSCSTTTPTRYVTDQGSQILVVKLLHITPAPSPITTGGKRCSLDIPSWKTTSRVFQPTWSIRLRRVGNAFLVPSFSANAPGSYLASASSSASAKPMRSPKPSKPTYMNYSTYT